MRQFKRVIHLFGEFKILCNETFFLDREIKKNLKCMHFFEVYQLAKLQGIQIHKKRWNLKFFSFNITLWTQPQTDPANPTTMTGWPGQTLQTDQTDLTTQTGQAGLTT